jgi:hypothetical protein
MSNVCVLAALRPYPNRQPVTFVPVPCTPRYWFADEIVSGGDFVTHLTREKHSRRAAYAVIAPFTPAGGEVRHVDERANRVTIDVRTAGNAMLVASNTYDEHWRATIDGEPVALVRTNVAYQGLVVPSGAHRVVIEYRNGIIAAGAGISLIAIAAALAMARKESFRRGGSIALSSGGPLPSE